MALPALDRERTYTAAEFFDLVAGDPNWEQIEGVPTPVCAAAWERSDIAGLIVTYLNNYVRLRRLGRVTVADGSFVIARDPDTMVQPDVAFIRSDRASRSDPTRAFDGVPDLAVEVRSPSDSLPEVLRKMERYLVAGTPLTWLVNPPRRQVHVRTAQDDLGRVFDEGDILEGGDVLPGFALPVDAIFDVLGDLRRV